MPAGTDLRIAALWGQILPKGRFRFGPNEPQGACEANELAPSVSVGLGPVGGIEYS